MPYHILVSGALGSGKTLTMSVLAHYFRNRVRAQGGDVKLFSNYGLLDSEPLTDYKDWYKVAEARGSICCWDETQMAFDSRFALKAENIYATQTLMYVRKMMSVQFYATPSVNNVDTRIRQLIEILVMARKTGKGGIALDFYDFQDKTAGAYGRHIITHSLPKWKIDQIIKLGLYDTFAMVKGFPSPKDAKDANNFFDMLEKTHNIARGLDFKDDREQESEEVKEYGKKIARAMLNKI